MKSISVVEGPAIRMRRSQGSPVIRQVGDKREKIEPFKINGVRPMYLRFSDLDGSEASCLKFANVFGLLTTQSREETLEGWRRKFVTLKPR